MRRVRLRAHHLLCLQGFRGLGYSPEFVEKMAAVHRQLFSRQETPVALTNQPDAICRGCPHLEDEGGCGRGEPQARDEAVLEALGAERTTACSWSAWLDRLASALDEETFERICGSCSWFDLGYCSEAMERLRATRKGDGQ